MNFGKRMGFQKPRIGLQIDTLEEGTRVRLWNVVAAHLGFNPRLDWGQWDLNESNADFVKVVKAIYDQVLRLPYSQIPSPSKFFSVFESWFLHQAKWWQVMEFMESLAAVEGETFERNFMHYARSYVPVMAGLREAVNKVLEQEMVGYRFVERHLLPVTDANEVESVEAAMASPATTVADHFKKAAALLSQKEQADFSDAVAQAISGVEAAGKFVTGRGSDVLSTMLQTLQAKHGAHPALAEVFKKMYGWASDGGIRHGKKKGDAPVDRDLAKCILVMCSGFANLLVASKAE